MGNGPQSDLDSRTEWRVRLATGLGTLVGATIALFVIRPLVHLDGILLGTIAFLAVSGLGGVLGRLAGYFLFQRRPGR
jgi:hypothetical protein